MAWIARWISMIATVWFSIWLLEIRERFFPHFRRRSDLEIGFPMHNKMYHELLIEL